MENIPVGNTQAVVSPTKLQGVLTLGTQRKQIQDFLSDTDNESFNMHTGLLTDKRTPLDLQNACNLVCCHEGWHSTWLTAGGTRATSSKSASIFVEKLLTPMARALPES